jgi:hypothetical protein
LDWIRATPATRAAVERDEPPWVGASLRRIDEQPPSKRQPAGDEGEALACDGEISALQQIFLARIEIVRRTLSKLERDAIIRALREELRAAIHEVTKRGRDESASRRLRRLAGLDNAPR